MFTGLVEAIGTIRDFKKTESVSRLSIECPEIVHGLAFGQSVSVSGACLTVVSAGGSVFDVEMIQETLTRTHFSSLTRGSKVNLERAMTINGRLEGHLVLGHVDGIATLEKITGPARTRTALFHVPEEMTRHIVAKGSIALDGVSLTVIDAGKEAFSVGLIPATLENTTLSRLKPGDMVNVETDIVGKYVERLLGVRPAVRGGASPLGALTLEELCKLGY